MHTSEYCFRARNRRLTPEEFTEMGLRKQNNKITKYLTINGKEYIYHPFRAVNTYSYDAIIKDEARNCWWGITMPPPKTNTPLAEAIEPAQPYEEHRV